MTQNLNLRHDSRVSLHKLPDLPTTLNLVFIHVPTP